MVKEITYNISDGRSLRNLPLCTQRKEREENIDMELKEISG
jgi:hypothetical protein